LKNACGQRGQCGHLLKSITIIILNPDIHYILPFLREAKILNIKNNKEIKVYDKK
jgi:hypothetical protein